MHSIVAEPEPSPAPPRRRLADTIRNAWELSKPPDYGLIEDTLASSVSGPLSWVARGQELIASVLFFGTFATVLVEVICRLAARPVVWGIELPTYFFIWAFCVAAGLSDWNDRHLAFDLIATKLPRPVKLILDIVVNVIFVVMFVLVLPGTISFLDYSATQPSTGLPFSQEWGYAGIVVLFGLGALLRTRLLWVEVAELWRRWRPSTRGAE